MEIFPQAETFQGWIVAVRVPSHIGARDGGRATPPPPKKKRKQLQKTMQIRANARENEQNSGGFTRKQVKFRLFYYNIPYKFGQTFNCPLGKRQPCTPMPSHIPSATRNLTKRNTTFCFLFTLLYYKDLKHILYTWHFKLITYYERFQIRSL